MGEDGCPLAFRLEGVQFTYRGGNHPALRGIDLFIARGQVVVVLGPSGAGKSTLCLCLDGLIPHVVQGTMQGRVEVFGVETADRRVAELAQDVGLVLQDFEAQLFSTDVRLEVAFGPENFAVPVTELRQRVKTALHAVGIDDLQRREPATLSGGQKQRLAIASVLSLEPRALVMDEPTTDLDPAGTQSVFAVVRQLRERGVTLLLVEHETEDVTAADRVVVLEDGVIVADGPPADVLIRSGWLEDHGIRPLGTAQLLECLGEPPVLTVEEAVTRLRERGYWVSDDRWRHLLQADDARISSYGDPFIEVRDLEYRYPNGVVALERVELTIHQGEFLAIVGQNGSGKTTLAKHFNGLLQPTAGEVRVAGRSTAGRSVQELSRLVGYVFQNPDHQLFAETVWEEVAFGPRNHGVGEDEVRARVVEALESVGMAGRDQADPFTLTKGERQRVAVASVLACRPQVLILDEPTTGLDYREQRRMMALVRRLNDAGHTVICITHAMWVIAEYAHRVVVLHEGRVMMSGATRQVLSREEELAAAHLKPSQIPCITGRLGRTLLTVDECRQYLGRS